MDPTLQIVLSVILSVFSAFVAGVGFFRQLKKDSALKEARIKELEIRIEHMQNTLSSISIVELAKMEQHVRELGKRVEKLDTDVEKKLDQLSEKMDGLVDKLNETLLQLMNR